MSAIDKYFELVNGFNESKTVIGKTANGKDIVCLSVGSGRPLIFSQYAIHAREYITAYLAFEQIKYCENLNVGTFCFCPMVNLDGVLLLENRPSLKANANGVDLNVNFDAEYGKGVFNRFEKSEENYVGTRAFSESETRALRDFTLFIKPDVTLSYHSKGEEIYWYFNQRGENLKRDRFLAEVLQKSTGYKLKYAFKSFGGYKDWCISKLKIPSFTIEVGSDDLTHPIGKENLWQITKCNLTSIKNLMNATKSL